MVRILVFLLGMLTGPGPVTSGALRPGTPPPPSDLLAGPGTPPRFQPVRFQPGRLQPGRAAGAHAFPPGLYA